MRRHHYWYSYRSEAGHFGNGVGWSSAPLTADNALQTTSSWARGIERDLRLRAGAVATMFWCPLGSQDVEETP